MSLKRTARFYLIRFKRLQGSSRSLAMGSAIGAAVGVTPTLPLHNVIILAITLPLRVNPIAGILAANVVSNPLTFVPQYYLAWKIGDFFLPGRLSWEKILSTLNLIKTEGIIGDRYVSVDPGGGGTLLKGGDAIVETEAPADLMDLVSKYAFGDVKK